MAAGKALFIQSGLTQQVAASDELQVDILDSVGATLSIGGTNTTTANIATSNSVTAVNVGTGTANKIISIGSAGDTINFGDEAAGPYTTEVVVKGNLTVNGTEHVVGESTFDDDATFKGNVTFGDPALPNPDTITFASDTRITSDMVFDGTTDRAIYVEGSATGAGQDLTLQAGDALAASAAAGGALRLYLGAADGAGANPSLWYGPDTYLNEADAYQILVNSSTAATEAGLRYDPTSNAWQLRVDNGTWQNIAAGDTMPTGTENQIIQKGALVWEARSNMTLPEGADRTVKVADSADGVGDALFVQAGAAFAASGAAGGNLILQGGLSDGTGTTGYGVLRTQPAPSTGATGQVQLYTGATSTGQSGDITIHSGNASGIGTSGDIAISAGTVAAGGTIGAVRLYHPVTLVDDAAATYARFDMASGGGWGYTGADNFSDGARFYDSDFVGMVWASRPGNTWRIMVEDTDATAAAGTNIQLQAGAGGTSTGGTTWIYGGAATALNQSGGDVVLVGGNYGGGTGGAGNVRLVPGTGAGARVQIGRDDVGVLDTYLAFINQNFTGGLTGPGFRYNGTAGQMEFCDDDSNNWQPFAAGGGAVVVAGTVHNQILQWDKDTDNQWEPSNDLTLPQGLGARTIKVQQHASLSGENLTVAAGDGSNADVTNGGNLILTGGAHNDTGNSGSVTVFTVATTGGLSGAISIATGSSTTAISGSISIHTGSATDGGDTGDVNIYAGLASGAKAGNGGNVIVTAGGSLHQGGDVLVTGGAGFAGNGGAYGGDVVIAGGEGQGLASGDVFIRGGANGTSSLRGFIYIGDSNTSEIVFGDGGALTNALYANSDTPATRAGIRYNDTDDQWEYRVDAGGSWLPFVGGGGTLPASTDQYTYLQGVGDGSWVESSDIVLPNSANRTISVEQVTAGNSGRNLTISAGDANGAAVNGGTAALKGGTSGTAGVGGSAYIEAGLGATVGGQASVFGGASNTGQGGVALVAGGNGGTGTGGNAVVNGGVGTTASGNVYLGNQNTGTVYFGGVSSTNVSFAGNAGTRITSDLVFNDSNRSIYIEDSNNNRTFFIHGSNAISGNSFGGGLQLIGGTATGTSTGGAVYLQGGDCAVGGTPGAAYIDGGYDGTSVIGDVYLGGIQTDTVHFGGTSLTKIDFVANVGNTVVSSGGYTMFLSGDQNHSLYHWSNPAVGNGGSFSIVGGSANTTGVGGAMSFTAGAGAGEAGNGGSVTITSGATSAATTTGGHGGNILLVASDGANAATAGNGGKITLEPGLAGTGGTPVNGWTNIGNTGLSASHLMFLDSIAAEPTNPATNGTSAAGIRSTAGVMQYKNTTGNWTAFGSGTVPNSTDQYTHLEGDASTGWVESWDITLPNDPTGTGLTRTITIQQAVTSASPDTLQIVGQAGNTTDGSGGDITITGGTESGDGDGGNVVLTGRQVAGAGSSGVVAIQNGLQLSSAEILQNIYFRGNANSNITVNQAAATADGWDLSLNGGSVGVGGANGGDVNIYSGAGGTGASGNIVLQVSSVGTTRGNILLNTNGGIAYIGSSTIGAMYDDSTNVFSMQGGSTLDLSVSASRWTIDGTTVGTTVTATNLNKLTNGSTLTSTDNLHYHSGTGASSFPIVAGEALAVGMVAGIAANSGAPTQVGWLVDAGTDKADTTTPFVAGIVISAAAGAGSTATLATGGEIDVPAAQFTVAPASAANNGDIVWASSTNPGYMTMTAPSSSGHYKTKIGYLKTYAAGGPHRVVIQIGDPVKM